MKLMILFYGKNFFSMHVPQGSTSTTFTEPSITCYSDACGGYIVNGLAWRFKIPNELLGYFSINFLEFIAAVLTIELAIESKNDNS